MLDYHRMVLIVLELHAFEDELATMIFESHLELLVSIVCSHQEHFHLWLKVSLSACLGFSNRCEIAVFRAFPERRSDSGVYLR